MADLLPRAIVAASLVAAGCTQETCVPAGPGLDAGTDAGVLRFEQCDDGRDNDGNGLVDDGCPCPYGAEQPCYGGPGDIAGVGICAWGTMRCGREPLGAWSECEGAGEPTDEQCDNGLDDDCDGRIDEACACELGATRPCFAGAASQADVGVCASGVQACTMAEEFPSWGACEGAVGPGAEVCNDLDDDCDGVADDIPEICDGADNDCDGDVDEGVCTEVRYFTRYWPPTRSDVLERAPLLYAATSAAPAPACPAGSVLLEHRPGEVDCVPETQPTCAAGTQADWTGARWECVPCHLLVQFGHLFAYERSCAPPPDLDCPCGEVPTYDVDAREWECRPLCDNTTYDIVTLPSGGVVCIPC